jgi:hypothetical protein
MAFEIGSAVYRITADLSGLQTGIAQAKTEARSLESVSTRQQAALQNQAAALVQSFKASTAPLEYTDEEAWAAFGRTKEAIKLQSYSVNQLAQLARGNPLSAVTGAFTGAKVSAAGLTTALKGAAAALVAVYGASKFLQFMSRNSAEVRVETTALNAEWKEMESNIVGALTPAALGLVSALDLLLAGTGQVAEGFGHMFETIRNGFSDIGDFVDWIGGGNSTGTWNLAGSPFAESAPPNDPRNPLYLAKALSLQYNRINRDRVNALTQEESLTAQIARIEAGRNKWPMGPGRPGAFNDLGPVKIKPTPDAITLIGQFKATFANSPVQLYIDTMFQKGIGAGKQADLQTIIDKAQSTLTYLWGKALDATPPGEKPDILDPLLHLPSNLSASDTGIWQGQMQVLGKAIGDKAALHFVDGFDESMTGGMQNRLTFIFDRIMQDQTSVAQAMQDRWMALTAPGQTETWKSGMQERQFNRDMPFPSTQKAVQSITELSDSVGGLGQDLAGIGQINVTPFVNTTWLDVAIAKANALISLLSFAGSGGGGGSSSNNPGNRGQTPVNPRDLVRLGAPLGRINDGYNRRRNR